ncbi:NUDIX hydrolase [Pseudooceanicola onchidii]|uniref:NUDIX hydrolase n=1 Tax=Pseudooceanicola onchidii TaxID=2562279 RepID=UPI001F0F32AE|nr:NUDIX hydrolase [Pseudooceanicola onchidii]
MSFLNRTSTPREFRKLDESSIREQYAALCYRVVNDKIRILLITSRGTKRWIVPKGWPMAGKHPHEAALTEAAEEAGVIGRVQKDPIGHYTYFKLLDDGHQIPCVGTLFPVHVRLLRAEYPEANERDRKWFSRKKAAKKVDEPELAALIRTFDPRGLD